MEPHLTELLRFLRFYDKYEDEDKATRAYDEILLKKLPIREYMALNNLSLCLTLEEFAKYLSKNERKKVTESAVKKRLERAFKKLKDHFKEVFDSDE